MQDALSNLGDLLREEHTLCRLLLDILKKEREALVGRSLDAITEITKRKETCLVKLKVVGESRRSLAARCAKRLHISPEDPELPELCSRLDPTDAYGLRALVEDLSRAAAEIRRFNDGNKALLEHSLSRIQSCLSFLYGFTQEKKTYDRSGEIGTPEAHARLLSRSA